MHFPVVKQNLVPEPRVKQVEYGMFRTTDVKIDRKPVFLFLGIPGMLRVFGVDVTQIVPARPCPLGHCVRLSPGCFRIPYPLGCLPKRGLRSAGGFEVFQFWEQNRQIRLLEGVHTVFFVDHNREWLAPVPLA